MVWLTGDTHGDFTRFIDFTKKMKLSEKDTMIVLGDAGLNYFGDSRDNARKEFVSCFPFSTFCIHGNHEMRPENIPSYSMMEYCGGMVWYEPAYPKILFARDGEVYDFDDISCLVIGGAYSVDKQYRLTYGYRWFSDEQPSEEIRARVETRLMEINYRVDVVLSHTCPLSYIPTEAFISGVDQSKVDRSTEIWLGSIEKKLSYHRWYCGHYHTVKRIDRMHFMYDNFDVLGSSE